MKNITDQIVGNIMAKPESTSPIKRDDLLSTGSTLLNMAMSGRPTGGHYKGCYTLFIGDSGSGKTIFALTTLAEAANNPHFAEYELIHDDVEHGNLFDIVKLFGEKLADRLRPPALDTKGSPKPSRTIEDFYFNAHNALDEGKPIIYVLDSHDALGSKQEDDKFKINRKKWSKGKELEGSYGDGKAKFNSEHLRGLVRRFEKTKSILVIICQTRELLNAGPFQESKTRAGGKALRFYAHMEVWTSDGGKIKKPVNNKNRTIGNNVIFKIKKNRLTGQLNEIKSAIYWSYGVDDIGSCIDWLIEEKWWKKSQGAINAGESFGKMSKQKLISKIENEGMKELRMELRACWKSIQDAMVLKRKPRYS